MKSSSIQATSSDAAATGCLAVVYNLVTPIANPSWSPGEPPTPYRRRASDPISSETTTALRRSMPF